MVEKVRSGVMFNRRSRAAFVRRMSSAIRKYRKSTGDNAPVMACAEEPKSRSAWFSGYALWRGASVNSNPGCGVVSVFDAGVSGEQYATDQDGRMIQLQDPAGRA